MSRPIRKTQANASESPIRAALNANSPLQQLVKDGLAAVKNRDRTYFDASVRASFADSLDVDKAFLLGREQEYRWDYLLGHKPSGKVVGVEPHTARNSEIDTVIKKRAAARDQLRKHLRNGASVSKWLLVASGNVQFVPIEKATIQLAQHGIEFVGKKIGNKHLP